MAHQQGWGVGELGVTVTKFLHLQPFTHDFGTVSGPYLLLGTNLIKCSD